MTVECVVATPAFDLTSAEGRIAFEEEHGYYVCGINGCLLEDSHSGPCAFPIVNPRRGSSSPTGILATTSACEADSPMEVERTDEPERFAAGDRVSVFWDGDDTRYYGVVLRCLRDGRVSVRYDDGQQCVERASDVRPEAAKVTDGSAAEEGEEEEMEEKEQEGEEGSQASDGPPTRSAEPSGRPECRERAAPKRRRKRPLPAPPAPTFDWDDLPLGGPTPAPEGAPVIDKYALTSRGRVSGLVRGKEGYKDSSAFETSRIVERHATHVVTESGRVYRLGCAASDEAAPPVGGAARGGADGGKRSSTRVTAGGGVVRLGLGDGWSGRRADRNWACHAEGAKRVRLLLRGVGHAEEGQEEEEAEVEATSVLPGDAARAKPPPKPSPKPPPKPQAKPLARHPPRNVTIRLRGGPPASGPAEAAGRAAVPGGDDRARFDAASSLLTVGLDTRGEPSPRSASGTREPSPSPSSSHSSTVAGSAAGSAATSPNARPGATETQPPAGSLPTSTPTSLPSSQVRGGVVYVGPAGSQLHAAYPQLQAPLGCYLPHGALPHGAVQQPLQPVPQMQPAAMQPVQMMQPCATQLAQPCTSVPPGLPCAYASYGMPGPAYGVPAPTYGVAGAAMHGGYVLQAPYGAWGYVS